MPTKRERPYIEDEFGAAWETCHRRDCSLEVVRVGKAQCEGRGDLIGCPTSERAYIDGLCAEVERLNRVISGDSKHVVLPRVLGDDSPRMMTEMIGSPARFNVTCGFCGGCKTIRGPFAATRVRRWWDRHSECGSRWLLERR